MSIAHRRSRSGSAATIASSSATIGAADPQASSASTSSSDATRRSSVSRVASASATAQPSSSSSGTPRQSAERLARERDRVGRSAVGPRRPGGADQLLEPARRRCSRRPARAGTRAPGSRSRAGRAPCAASARSSAASWPRIAAARRPRARRSGAPRSRPCRHRSRARRAPPAPAGCPTESARPVQLTSTGPRIRNSIGPDGSPRRPSPDRVRTTRRPRGWTVASSPEDRRSGSVHDSEGIPMSRTLISRGLAVVFTSLVVLGLAPGTASARPNGFEHGRHHVELSGTWTDPGAILDGISPTVYPTQVLIPMHGGTIATGGFAGTSTYVLTVLFDTATNVSIGNAIETYTASIAGRGSGHVTFRRERHRQRRRHGSRDRADHRRRRRVRRRPRLRQLHREHRSHRPEPGHRPVPDVDRPRPLSRTVDGRRGRGGLRLRRPPVARRAPGARSHAHPVQARSPKRAMSMPSGVTIGADPGQPRRAGLAVRVDDRHRPLPDRRDRRRIGERAGRVLLGARRRDRERRHDERRPAS